MEIQRIKLPAAERKQLFDFMGEDPGPTIDFNCLMSVVEKIEYEGYEVDIYKNVCEINTEDMIRFVAENKIEATCKAVVEFIKYFETRGAEE